MRKLTYRIHLEPEPEGGFTVTVPALRGCVTWGEDFEHAVAMAKEAVEVYVEVLAELGQSIPIETIEGPIDTVIHVSSPAVA